MGENAERLLRMAAPPVNDQQLLDLIRAADGTAFTELVRRHGPMVLGVCRRVLNHEQDAEDAFQATFLVLAKRATSVRNRQSVGAWLFGVAQHVAIRLRDKNRRRNRHERAIAHIPNPGSTDHDQAGWLALLEEELHRLPDKYKSPLVVCHIQGRTQEDAAKEMRLSLSTLRRRLEHARELLRVRLARRGVGLPIGLSGLMSLTVVMPSGLAETTSRAVAAFILGERGTVPATLAQGVLTMMAQVKLKLVTGAVLAVTVAVGLWYTADGSPRADAGGQVRSIDKSLPDGARPEAKQPEQKQKPVDDRIKPGDRLRIVIGNGVPDVPNDGVLLVEPSGKIALHPAYGRVEIGGVSPEEAETIIRKHLVESVGLKRPLVQVTRYDAVKDDNRIAALEARVKVLEIAVSKLSEEIAGVPKK
jgi:polysaccharide biosynthesis/export protein